MLVLILTAAQASGRFSVWIVPSPTGSHSQKRSSGIETQHFCEIFCRHCQSDITGVESRFLAEEHNFPDETTQPRDQTSTSPQHRTTGICSQHALFQQTGRGRLPAKNNCFTQTNFWFCFWGWVGEAIALGLKWWTIALPCPPCWPMHHSLVYTGLGKAMVGLVNCSLLFCAR